MLWNVYKRFENGDETKDLVYSPSTIKINPKQDNIKSAIVSRFMYEYNHYMSPHLYISSDNKKYIMPIWMEVHPDTVIEDIKWVRPEVKEPKQTEVIKTEGSLGTYKTSYNPDEDVYKCTCPGFWRSKGNCKHVRLLREKNLAN